MQVLRRMHKLAQGKMSCNPAHMVRRVHRYAALQELFDDSQFAVPGSCM